ncbi:NYN domain-containing protein [Acidobacteria bacterium AH-259-D05]|nr:NYN domain-containing protein [Acidobacteria bacterium AH-259-D05]
MSTELPFTSIRVTFLIDGFNLYHSLKQASWDLGEAKVKWLDIKALCAFYLFLIDKQARLEEIYYFSALAKHLEATNPDLTARHRTYTECLKSSGVVVEFARFKKKSVNYRSDTCRVTIDRYEEKETDVAIAAKLFELFHRDRCDVAVLVTGDTDMTPAVKTAQRLFEKKTVCFLFPYRRKNKELAQLVSKSWNIKKERYLGHQFPNPVILTDGQEIYKPLTW